MLSTKDYDRAVYEYLRSGLDFTKDVDYESQVVKSITNLCFDPSSMVHVKSYVNEQGPPFKAKYSWVTDNEVISWGKGEKNSHLDLMVLDEKVGPALMRKKSF